MKQSPYSEKLRNPLWQKRRLEVMQRDCWQCCFCGDKETTLNVHHLKYSGDPWEAPEECLITLCEDCHFVVEDLKKRTFGGLDVLKIHKGELGIYKFVLHDDGLTLYEGKDLCFSISQEYAKILMHFLIDTYINEDVL